MHEPVVLVVVNGFEGTVFGEEDNIVALRIEVEAVVVSYEPGLVGRSVEEVEESEREDAADVRTNSG